MVPATHKKLVVKLRINEVSKYLEHMAPDRFERMCLDLQLGYIIRLRGDIYVKQQKTGEYFVYRKPGERSERSIKSGAVALPAWRGKSKSMKYTLI